MKFLDNFFLIFHTFIIFFNLFGWIWKGTRKANLILLSLTGFSWFILGIWYGIGYCPCTEWHWQVKIKLGETDLPNSYIKHLIDTITGWDVNAQMVDVVAMVFFVLAVICSVCINVRDRNRGK